MAGQSVREVLSAAVEALAAGERVALLTIVRAEGSTPRRSGAKMLVRQGGSIAGTIGGGTLEERATADAQAVLAGGGTVVKTYEFSASGQDSVGLCGGVVDVSIEALVPPTRLLIIGAGHIAQPLAAMAAMAGMDVVVVDDRAEWASRERFPTAQAIHVVAYDRQTETLPPLPVTFTASTAVVLATWGWDEPALRQVLAAPAFYVGLVASRRKLKLIGEKLLAHGMLPDALSRIHAPAGLELGGESPGEIALSILAEIMQVSHAASGRPLSEVRRLAGGRPPHAVPPRGTSTPSGSD